MIKKNIIKNNLSSHKVRELKGIISPPPDKSISHRALLFSALAMGKSTIVNLLHSEDVLNMVKALKALGVNIIKRSNIYYVIGVGLNGFNTPSKHIDCGNSGTLARILLGAIGGSEIIATLVGDLSLSSRPMDRVINPLKKMGISFNSINNKLPLIVRGASDILPIKYISPISSAQVKTTILLAGLNSKGTSEIIEPYSSRNHSENLLKHYGADIKYDTKKSGKNSVLITGGAVLKSCNIIVPGDNQIPPYLSRIWAPNKSTRYLRQYCDCEFIIIGNCGRYLHIFSGVNITNFIPLRQDFSIINVHILRK